MSTLTRKRKKTFTVDATTQVFRLGLMAYDRVQLLFHWKDGAGSSFAVEAIDEYGLPSAARGFTVDGSPFTQAAATANIAGAKAMIVNFTWKARAIRLKYTAGTCTEAVAYCKVFTNSLADVDDASLYDEAGTADTDSGEALR